MKTYRGSRGITPLILNLGCGWRRVVKFTPRARTPVHTEQEAGWAPEPVWAFHINERHWFSLLTESYDGGQTKESEIDCACGTNGGGR